MSIRGMRLALPESVRGVKIKRITAYDCSDTVNDVYDLNFHSNTHETDSSVIGHLKRVTVSYDGSYISRYLTSWLFRSMGLRSMTLTAKQTYGP